MTLIKTGLLNAIAVAIKLFSMLVLNKILAVMVGPSGYALIGQLQNAITSITALASAGVGTGVTKYTSEYSAMPVRQHEVWRTAFFIGIACSITIGIVLIVFHVKLAQYILNDKNYSYVFIWVAACLLLYVFNTLFLAILNGLKEVGLFVSANIANSIAALVITGTLVWQYNLRGALIALAINQSIVFLITVYILRRRPWFQLRNFVGKPDYQTTLNLSKFTLMALATSVLGPISLILVRNILIGEVGIEIAGYWEALTRISNIYLMFISTPLSVYYLPKLSELVHTYELRKELKNGLKLLVPITISLAVFTYVMREVIIRLLFSDRFLPMEPLFAWQLTGDIIRVIAWLFSYLIISKAMVKKFLTAEIFANITFIILSYLGAKTLGVSGVVVAYAVNNTVYLIALLVLASPLLRIESHSSAPSVTGK